MNDSISRRMVINALDRINCLGYIEEKWETVSGIIERLPSVQSEIIRCKDCKWCEDADGPICKNPASWVVATDYDFGCVYAERRDKDGSK